MMKSYTTSPFFLIGSLAITIIVVAVIYFYLTSPNVDAGNWGGPEEFGQFGDMLGGILNPVFGFLTVILLIRTFKLESSKTSLERKLKNKEELLKLLDQAKSDNKRLIETSNFSNNEGTHDESFANIRQKKEEFSQALEQIDNTIAILKQNKNPTIEDVVQHTLTNRIDGFYFAHIKNIFHQTIDIIQIYTELLDRDFPQISNKYYIRELDNYLALFWLRFKVFNTSECLQYILNACERAGIDANELNLSFSIIEIKRHQ